MKLDSKYFDAIRVKGKRAADKPRAPECAWEGCDEAGIYKAPMGRDHEGQYLHFCVDHVRQYNKSYNYFSGLDDKDIQRHLKDSLTGDRPTWKMGHSGAAPGDAAKAATAARTKRRNGRTRDPFNIFTGEDAPPRPQARRTKVRSLEAKALKTLDLSQQASAEAIRARYKNLVKQLHPDANGGDRGTEDRLREVIQAYKLLKQSGFC
ncbi:MAG TPA: molecular chaperone DnaJ [Aurantimonas coralicida]|uniref:Molecular chaperone DnaJ n=2 Tax=root TaxID=1 RepID=A0A9C9TIJ2_9HYPH|nr:J domain-containing protein [Aurantimonas sp. A3-2-R12]HDZ72877.1 molecular chaperone DnaJ [Aurantimonas coralicida]HEU01816.1 molecular chaperone DnaJ [Aurantimonas coralicida]